MEKRTISVIFHVILIETLEETFRDKFSLEGKFAFLPEPKCFTGL